VSQSPPSSRGSDEIYPRVRLGKASLAIQDQECQRVIGIVAMLSQLRSAEIALHRNQVKRGIALVMLQPLCPAATEVAQAVKNDDSALGFHNPTSSQT
jgi:hypothetical protein